MTTITCDRCGQYLNDPTTLDLLRGKRTDEEREIVGEFDLCRDCEAQLLEWLRRQQERQG
jgi:hypothetical protein